MYIQEQ